MSDNQPYLLLALHEEGELKQRIMEEIESAKKLEANLEKEGKLQQIIKFNNPDFSRIIVNYNIIFIKPNFNKYTFLGLFCSKMYRYLLDNFNNHTVAKNQIDILATPLPLVDSNIPSISNNVQKIIHKLQLNANYNFIEEQKEIDRIVYQLYGLNEEDINEVETWFARRYPKLAKYADIKEQVKVIAESRETEEEKWLAIIHQGENKKVEFKSTLRYCIKEKSPQAYVEHSAIKNIAAFLN